jgi:hypothetical protein
LAFFRTVDAAETDAFSMVTVQDFDGVAIKNGDDSSSVVGSKDNSWDEHGCQQQE